MRDLLHLKSHWRSRRRDASTFTALPGSRKIHASLSFPRSMMAGSITPAQKSDVRDLLHPESHRRAAGWKHRFPLERRVGQKGKEKDRKGDTQRIYNREEKGDTMRSGSVLAAFWQRSGSAREKASMALQYRKTKVHAAGKETDIKLL